MNIRFLDSACQELDEAVAFYAEERPGLEYDLLREITHALNSIVAFPQAWHPLSKRSRRCRLRRFPYGLIYQVREDELLIVAVAHMHRKPDYWKNRAN
ncbi:type II toxin-antitoxin system RelE/ParE family toxin [Mariprofundus sp. NF]|uniref:type II toxin-antitoxin system RelE/ParE family toxin n=1 Tax=Mariprofundus sp. NF TaxID=2608716 RepID=UPI0015A4AD3A|nr:type II toxin-antitoxin system RelE/ParE family toxin [Mariprofundus sp. NF]